MYGNTALPAALNDTVSAFAGSTVLTVWPAKVRPKSFGNVYHTTCLTLNCASNVWSACSSLALRMPDHALSTAPVVTITA